MSRANSPDPPPFPVCGDCTLAFNEEDLKPLLLPCQHVFCKSCLNDQEDNDCQNCPTCSDSWSGRNVAQLSVVYDLIPPSEDAAGRQEVPAGTTGREVVPTSREEVPTCSTGRDMRAGPRGAGVTPMVTGREVTPMETGREVTPAYNQDKRKTSARFPACTICEHDFNMNSQRPLKLPCGHCFCWSCLEVLRSAGKSSCPKCRGEWTITEMSKLPVVKSLIHPANKDKNVQREPSAAAGKWAEDRLKAAKALSLSGNAQTKQTKQIKSEIYVRDTNNRTRPIQVDLQRDTVLQLRTLVAQVTGVQAGAQRLLHNSRQLEDGYTLAHYNIRAYDTITQTCRLQGGAV